jgi:regulator of RNase E activity RraA
VSGSDDQFQNLLRGFGALPTAIVADCMNRLAGTSSLRPYHRSSRLCGVAYTVRVAAGDNLYIHHALNVCNSGDVVVVEGGGDTTRALTGELMMLFAQSRGVSGFVIDGAVRDAEAFRSHDFPCFARGQTMRGPYKNGPGTVQVPVSIDGMIVNPGDRLHRR